MMRAIAVAAAVLALVVACDESTQQACDCDDPTITINVPQDVADSAQVHLSGQACQDILPVCSNQTNGCSQWRFDAEAGGDCHIEIDFANGQVFTDDITILDESDNPCCGGYFATPLSAATVDVPEPDGG